MQKEEDKKSFKYIIAIILSCVMTLSFASDKNIEKFTKISINYADVNELITSELRVGNKRALAIVNYRDTHGPIKSCSELAKVRGFSKAYIKKYYEKLNEIYIFD